MVKHDDVHAAAIDAITAAWNAFCDSETVRDDYSAAIIAAINAAKPYILLVELRRLVDESRKEPYTRQAEELDVLVSQRIRELESEISMVATKDEIVDHNVAAWEIANGRVYDKLVKVEPAGNRSAVVFIDRFTGVYYWASGWSKRGSRMVKAGVEHYRPIVEAVRAAGGFLKVDGDTGN